MDNRRGKREERDRRGNKITRDGRKPKNIQEDHTKSQKKS